MVHRDDVAKRAAYGAPTGMSLVHHIGLFAHERPGTAASSRLVDGEAARDLL